MLKSYKLPLEAVLAIPTAIALEQLCLGAGFYFTFLISLCLIFIGLAYNALGGLGTFSGIIFSCFAARTIVISQLAKTVLLERSDKHLEAPLLTASIYAVFFGCAYVASLSFAKLRIQVPKPLEVSSPEHRATLYTVTCVLGVVATIIYESLLDPNGSENKGGGLQSVALAFTTLMTFALIVAIDNRLRQTGGRHSINLAVAVPWIAGTFFGFIDTTRTATILPTIAYVVCCFVRGYRFRFRHWASLTAMIAVFFVLISPFALFARYYTRIKGIPQRTAAVFTLLKQMHDPAEIRGAFDRIIAQSAGGAREQYFDASGTRELSRLSLIRADSALISTCANGFHYGFTGLEIEFSRMMPSFLQKDKQTVGELNYLGHITGLAKDRSNTVQIQFSAVADSFGAFGWVGVILMPTLGFSAIFVLYESMFGKMSKPWNTVALATCIAQFGEMNVGRLAPLLIRFPLYILLASICIGKISSILVLRNKRMHHANAGLTDEFLEHRSAL